MKNIKIQMIRIIITLLSFASFAYVGLNCNVEEYEYMYTLPLFYMFIFLFIYSKKLTKGNSAFYLIILILSFLRYVVLPVLIVKSEYFWGRSIINPSKSSFNLSFYLMIYEFLIMSFFINYYENKYLKREKMMKKLTLDLRFNKNIVFFIFAFLLICYLIIDKRWLLGVNFFIVTSLENEIDPLTFLVSYLFFLIKNIIYVYLVYYLSVKYNKNKNLFYLILAFLVTILNIGIFLGVNRADILMPALVSIFLLYKLFPKKIVSKFSLLLLIGGVTLISSVTESRGFYKPNNMTPLQVKTDEFQAYLGGPYNVAIATEIEDYFPEATNIQVFIFDVFRPMFGINMLVKDFDLKYSNQYFNERIFFTDHMSQIIPMAGQGYLFFGVFFAPIINILFIYISYKLISIAQNTSNVLLFYFFMISFVRTSLMMGHNAMNLISDLSFNLFILLFIFYLNKKIKFQN